MKQKNFPARKNKRKETALQRMINYRYMASKTFRSDTPKEVAVWKDELRDNIQRTKDNLIPFSSFKTKKKRTSK